MFFAWYYLRIFYIIIPLSSYPFLRQAVTNRVAKCSKIIPICGDISVFDQREVQVSIEALLHASDVFNQRNFTKGYRFLLFQIALWFLCHALACFEITSFRHKNKQKLICKMAKNTARNMQSFEVLDKTGGSYFRLVFSVDKHQTALQKILKIPKTPIFSTPIPRPFSNLKKYDLSVLFTIQVPFFFFCLFPKYNKFKNKTADA